MNVKTFANVIILFVFSWEFTSALNTFKKTNSCVCGQYDEYNPRIVNGKPAAPHTHPWMALIIKDYAVHCGGALINDRYVLTAGHCLFRFRKKRVKVALGVTRLEELSSRGGLEALKSVVWGKTHWAFSKGFGHDINDIGLIKLKSRVTFTPDIQPICLPLPGTDYTGKTAVVFGWGSVGEDKDISNALMSAEINVVPESKCKNNSIIGSYILKSMLCGYRRNVDACQGDSGGPLIFENPKGYYEEIGIVSWGTGCARPGIPGVYTKLTKYLTWIARNTKDSTYCERPK